MSKVKKQLIEELEELELYYGDDYEPSEEEIAQAKIQNVRDDDDYYEFIDEDLPNEIYFLF